MFVKERKGDYIFGTRLRSFEVRKVNEDAYRNLLGMKTKTKELF